MKKKILACALSFAVCFSVAMLANACKDKDTECDCKKAYELYVLYAQENGQEVAAYEEWLATIFGAKGDKGDKGDNGDKGDKGDKGNDGKGVQDIQIAIIEENGEKYMQFTIYYTEGEPQIIKVPMPTDTENGAENTPTTPDNGDDEPTNPDNNEEEPNTPDSGNHEPNESEDENKPLTATQKTDAYISWSAKWRVVNLNELTEDQCVEYELKARAILAKIENAVTLKDLKEIEAEFNALFEEVEEARKNA